MGFALPRRLLPGYIEKLRPIIIAYNDFLSHHESNAEIETEIEVDRLADWFRALPSTNSYGPDALKNVCLAIEHCRSIFNPGYAFENMMVLAPIAGYLPTLGLELSELLVNDTAIDIQAVFQASTDFAEEFPLCGPALVRLTRSLPFPADQVRLLSHSVGCFLRELYDRPEMLGRIDDHLTLQLDPNSPYIEAADDEPTFDQTAWSPENEEDDGDVPTASEGERHIIVALKLNDQLVHDVVAFAHWQRRFSL